MASSNALRWLKRVSASCPLTVSRNMEGSSSSRLSCYAGAREQPPALAATNAAAQITRNPSRFSIQLDSKEKTGIQTPAIQPNVQVAAKQATTGDQAQEQRTTRHPETRLTRRGRARTDCYVSHLGWTLGSWWPDHCNMLACLCASWHFHSAVDHRVTKLIHPLIRRLLEHSSVYYDTST